MSDHFTTLWSNGLKVSNKVKNINKKTEQITFSMILLIENFNPNDIKIDEKSSKIFLFIILDV